VFTQVRLPVREDALELVDKNPEALYRGLTLDANARTCKVYVADLILVDRISRIAHVVDIKRSLGSYESARILELRQRMLAGALVAPDLLWRDHQRVSVDEVRVVILEAAGKRTDVRTGLWNFSHLDHLLGVSGAAGLVRDIRDAFARLSESNLIEARERLRQKQMPDPKTTDAVDAVGWENGQTPGLVHGAGRDRRHHVMGQLDGPRFDGRQSQDHRPRIGVAPPPPHLQ
jgi:hypothetical protein